MKTKNKIYLASVLFLISGAVLVAFLIYPTFLGIKRGAKEILSNREKAAYIYSQNMELVSYKTKLRENETDFKKIEQSFVNPEEPLDFIKFLEKESSDLNIGIIINLIEGSGKTAGSLANSSFQISAKGDFQNMLKFYQKIEKGPYLLKIIKLSIAKLVQEGKAPSANMVESVFLIQLAN